MEGKLERKEDNGFISNRLNKKYNVNINEKNKSW